MASQFIHAEGQRVRNKNKPLNTNAIGYRRNEEERGWRSMLEVKGLDPDDPKNAKQPYVHVPFPTAMYHESGQSCLAETQEHVDALLKKGWAQKPFPAVEQISELDLLRRELAQIKTAQADQNELADLRKELSELRKQVNGKMTAA